MRLSTGSTLSPRTGFSLGDMKNTHVRFFSDAARFAWGGALSPNAIEANVHDYWDASTIQADIVTKETLALNNVLESFDETIKDLWVDAFVDSMVLIRSWNCQRSRSQSLSGALKKLFNINLYFTLLCLVPRNKRTPFRDSLACRMPSCAHLYGW